MEIYNRIGEELANKRALKEYNRRMLWAGIMFAALSLIITLH
jgi:hypothetical protein